MDSFEGVVKFLFEQLPAGLIPQIGVAGATKKALAWWPGKAAKTGTGMPPALKIKFYGCTNKAYPDPRGAMADQPCSIFWAGIDIDGDDNPHLSFQSLVEVVAQVIGPDGSIRTSCGGRGLHVFLRLATPISMPANPQRGHISRITQMISRPWIERLVDAGVHVCKNDSRMFWVYGGANRWVYKSTSFLSEEMVSHLITASSTLHLPVLTPEVESLELGEFVAEWLKRLGVKTPGPVYVGAIVERLRAEGQTVRTKSRCSGNGEINGYIDAGEGWIQLWSYADGHAIWRDQDYSWLEAEI